MNGTDRAIGAAPSDAKNVLPKRRRPKPPRVVIPPERIRVTDLRRIVREIPRHASMIVAGVDAMEARFRLSAYTLLKFLGPEWVDYYLTYKGLMLQSTYFGDIDRYFLRVGTLAEMLLNLQDVSGFAECLGLLADGRIESAFAELEVAKFLSMLGVKFRFNERSGGAKADYDLIVFFQNGEQGCAETKCKLEQTPLTEQTVFNTLRQARSQLPNDRPGVIIVKIPEEWIRSESFGERINPAVKRFLSDTETVVAVELFATGFKCIGDLAEPVIAGVEVMNQYHQFDMARDWSLIGPIAPTQMCPPSWWKSIPVLVDPYVDPRLFRP